MVSWVSMKIELKTTLGQNNTYRIATIIDGAVQGVAVVPHHEVIKTRNQMAERWSEHPDVTHVHANEIPVDPVMR